MQERELLGTMTAAMQDMQPLVIQNKIAMPTPELMLDKETLKQLLGGLDAVRNEMETAVDRLDGILGKPQEKLDLTPVTDQIRETKELLSTIAGKDSQVNVTVPDASFEQMNETLLELKNMMNLLINKDTSVSVAAPDVDLKPLEKKLTQLTTAFKAISIPAPVVNVPEFPTEKIAALIKPSETKEKGSSGYTERNKQGYVTKVVEECNGKTQTTTFDRIGAQIISWKTEVK